MTDRTQNQDQKKNLNESSSSDINPSTGKKWQENDDGYNEFMKNRNQETGSQRSVNQ